MSSRIDRLLLTGSQQDAIDRAQQAYMDAYNRGDSAGMKEAHAQAEWIRSNAGYSGGEAGDSYRLLKTSDAPAGHNGYEDILNRYANGAMSSIAAGYEEALAGLDRDRERLIREGEANQTDARSAAWNRQRLASDGLLTRGMSNTGLADVITATALNQASANAYQALLDNQNDLRENDEARSTARTTAMGEAGALQERIGTLLGNAYQSFYENEQDDLQTRLLKELQYAYQQQAREQDYDYERALKELQRQWQLEDLAVGR